MMILSDTSVPDRARTRSRSGRESGGREDFENMSEMYVGAMALGNPAVEYYIPGDLHISQMESGGVLEWWEEYLVTEIQFVD